MQNLIVLGMEEATFSRTSSEAISLENIGRWSETFCSGNDTTYDSSELSRCPYDPQLNDKLSLWFGDIWKLEVDAIVNSTNETLTDRSGLCGEILDAAGDEIALECNMAEKCRTGEAVMTRGCQLPASRIIHTVAPRFNEKYRTAAEHALHGCYRSCMRVAKEHHLRTIAISCLYIPRKLYPRDEAAGLAARTVRRFLEHYPDDFDRVVLCMNDFEDLRIYQQLLPVYFPRSLEEEQQALASLPEDIGGEFGEPIIEERKIRISSSILPENEGSPQAGELRPLQDKENDPLLFTCDQQDYVESFCNMTVDFDKQRLEDLHIDPQAPVYHKRESTYNDCLQKAQTESFGEIEALKLIYQAGVDQDGDPVIVYIGSHLPVKSVSLDRVLLYIIQVMDDIADGNYNFVYVHSNVRQENQPELWWFKRLFETLSSKYHENLKQFYVIHPTMWLKMALWVIKAIVVQDFYDKVVYINDNQQLRKFAAALKLPPHTYEERDSNISDCARSQAQL